MLYVKVIINGYVDAAHPGWVECSLIDAQGQEWIFIEKVPVVTNADLDENSDYPQSGFIACEFIEEHLDADNTHVVTINTESGESTEGRTQFEVHAGQLISSE